MFLFALLASNTSIPLANFSTSDEINRWEVVNDGVMGGKSSGNIELKDDTYGYFHGHVSLRNNGGFTSIRKPLNKTNIKGLKVAKLRIKGDGKSYQFRVKSERKDRHVYKYEFETTGEWETISISLKEMTPTYRGYTPDLPNYQAETLAQIGLLIANKKAENFSLLIENIALE